MAAPTTLTYKLTEEVARQAVEVAFTTSGSDWHVSFSNPTAGPWKKIQLPPEYGSRIFRYGKEEDRPDLILVSPMARTGLILEAKDSLAKLLVAGQLEKSVEVFRKEMDRFQGVMPVDFTWACGYVYPVLARETGLLAALTERHTSLGVACGDVRVAPSLHISVETIPNGDLQVVTRCLDFSSEHKRILLSALATTAARSA